MGFSSSYVIKNLTQSNQCCHRFVIYLAQTTTPKQLETFKQRIDEFLTDKETNNHLRYRDVEWRNGGIDGRCRLQMTLWVGSFISFSDLMTKGRQQNAINNEIRQSMLDLDIQFVEQQRLQREERELEI